MELQFSSTLITFSVLALILAFKLFMKSSKTPSMSTNLPPGPWKLPVIGNLHHLVGSPPHIALRDLARRYGPIMHLKLGEVSTIVISSSRLAKEVLKTHDLAFANRMSIYAGHIMLYGSTDIAFSPYGLYWRQMRKITTLELLAAKNVLAFSSIRHNEAQKLMEVVRSSLGTPIDLHEILQTFSNVVTCQSAFGSRCEHQDVFISLLKEANLLASGFSVSDLFPSLKLLPVVSGMKSKLIGMHRKIDKILEGIVNEHIATGDCGPGDEDLVHALLRHQKSCDLQCRITTDNIKAILLDMLIGGTDTTSVTVEWAMSELTRNPSVMNKVQAELRHAALMGNGAEDGSADIQDLNYLNWVIKETLRLHPPLPLVPRECRQECEIDGHRIPIKTKVLVNAWSIGRDPEYWDDAERFIPERFSDDFMGNDLRFLPFGAGRRICPGMNFGLANVKLPLAQLLYHFNWKLPDGKKAEDLDMTELSGAATIRKNNLFLVATPYAP